MLFRPSVMTAVVSMGFPTGYSRDDFLKNVDTAPRQPFRTVPALQKDLAEDCPYVRISI